MGDSSRDAAFADFVHASWPGLYRTAHLLLGDHGLAEDLTQTALTKTYLAWGRIREPDAAYSYARTTFGEHRDVVVPTPLVAQRDAPRGPRDRRRGWLVRRHVLPNA